MPQPWEPVYDRIKTRLLADIKQEIGEIDLSGGTVKDIVQVVLAIKDIVGVVDTYADELAGLDRENRRSLFQAAADEAIVIPGWLGKILEQFDGTLAGEVYDLIDPA